MVGRVGIEPTKAKPKDLQSSPFDHSGTDPYYESNSVDILLFFL